MTYRTLDNGRIVDERHTTYRWWVLSEQRLTEELAVHGLSVERTGPSEAGLFLVHRR